MRDLWYGDKRDLVKWTVLVHLADRHRADRIVQVAYHRESKYPSVTIGGEKVKIPNAVVEHFRDIAKAAMIPCRAAVSVLDIPFQDRETYAQSVASSLKFFSQEKCVVLLDPDTGLAPVHPTMAHVLDTEVRAIWEMLKSGDILVLYQHQTNRRGEKWMDPKKSQFERALGVPEGAAELAFESEAADVALLYIVKPMA